MDHSLYIHLPKGIVVASKLWQLCIKLLQQHCAVLCGRVLSPLGWKPRHMILRSYGNNMLCFVRNHQIVSQGECTILHFCQQWLRVAVASYLHKHLVLLVFWILAILMVSHCFNLHFPSNKWREAFFHMLICYPEIFFGEVSINILAHFLNGLFVFLLLSFNSLYLWEYFS